MRILHVFDDVPADIRRTAAEIDAVEQDCEHVYMLQRPEDGTTYPDSGVLLFDADAAGFALLLAQMEKADRIIWHGFSWKRRFLLYIWRHREYLKRSVWHVSEDDAIEVAYTGWNLPKRLYYRFKHRCKGMMAAYAADNIEQYYRVKNSYGRNKRVFLVGGGGDRRLAEHLRRPESTEEHGGIVHVLIGSCCHEGQTYTKTLRMLSRFMYQDICVHVPLAGTGSRQTYAREIEELTRKIFGYKAVFYRQALSPEERDRLYRQADVGIFWEADHHSLQDALAMCCLGKTVYVADMLRRHYGLAEVAGVLKRVDSMSRIETVQGLLAGEDSAETESLEEPRFDREKVLRQIASFDRSDGWRALFDGTQEEHGPVKFLHVIQPRQNIIQPFISLCQTYFPLEEHRFFVDNTNIRFAPGLAVMPHVEFQVGRTVMRQTEHLFARMHAAEHVIIHGMYLSKWEILRLAYSPGILKKAAWVEWGKDLYGYEKTGKGLKVRLHNYLHKRIRENISCFVSIFPPDEKVFRQRFRNPAPVLQTNYLASNSIEMLEKTRPAQTRTDGKVRVQVAHSCNSWNNHQTILDALAHLKFEDLELYIPLSTGSPPKNKTDVARYAKLLFAEKANFLFDEMDKENYFRFLWSMDIAVFSLYRQAALGNIIRLLYMGKKVFLPKNSVMYDFFAENGVEIYDTEAIADMSYEEFTAPLKGPVPHPFIVRMMNAPDLVNAWDGVFAYLAANGK